MIRISSSARTWLSAAMFAAALAAGCTRDESESQKKGPIEVASLPTPKTTVRVGQALPTPVPAHTAGGPAPTAAAAAPKSPTAFAEPTAVPAKPEKTAGAPPEKQETPKETAAPAPAAIAKKGIVGRGTDLLAGASPDAKVRGTFQGRTDVDVLETDGAYSHVQAPVVGGGAVEGWVLSSAVQAPGAKPAAVAKTDKPAAPPAGGETKASPASSAKPAVAKPPAAAPAKSGGGENKGPADILLKAIAGMAAKRPGTPFTHKKHYDDYSVKCVECHHAVKAKGGAVPATKTCTDAGCHLADQCNGQPVPKKNDACPAFEDAYHKNCIDCHRQQSGPTKCAECHTG